MNILIINSGSSSIKFQLIDMAGELVLINGLVERIGETDSYVTAAIRPRTERQTSIERKGRVTDHKDGMRAVVELLTDAEHGVLKSLDDIDGIGHRVVHGGEDFQEPTIIDTAVIAAIRKNSELAPLHNPANLDGIEVARELLPAITQVAVFDTAFHQTIPEQAHIYALPYELYTNHQVRRYGFHGTSHKFVAGECARLINRPIDSCNFITVHLGNGCSMTAIENGKSIDTTLGMTPLEGLVMGTRSGDVDPAIHAFLNRSKRMSLTEIDQMLNKESGLKGICGMNDMRDIHAAAEGGDQRARLAVAVQTYRNKKYIGAYMAVLGRVDALIFTAGIGENDDIVRARSVAGLSCFGLEIDELHNKGRKKEPSLISSDKSTIPIWVIPTNEELAIARETASILVAE